MTTAKPKAKVADDVDEIDAGDDAETIFRDLEFKGDKLSVRVPSQQALAAFSLSTSKYIGSTVRNDMTGLFINRHLSPESYEQVFSRLMDPDDNDYTVESIGELMRAIVELS